MQSPSWVTTKIRTMPTHCFDIVSTLQPIGRFMLPDSLTQLSCPIHKGFRVRVLGLSRTSLSKWYREAVRVEKVEFWHHHNFQ